MLERVKCLGLYLSVWRQFPSQLVKSCKCSFLPPGVVAVCRQTKVNSLKHTPPALEAIAVTQRIQPATIHLQIPRHNYVHELRL